ncbi:MAG: DUF2237 domain-containing protein [Salibacteraceae bacterium]|jgi:uncharacterized protein|nr:DUF2237 domain-containing protein [Salibacteraceae bacterium]MDP4763757.1 DUF2237 domain-containing protein [Salibacteraceae bacterium]MDP4844508.1 DUF2237 domain-containing protein [Salibacteraceae bacterium]MDP4935684.1 DUF2237 domain-containing protein [Salibacteraceae bacterium]
MNVFGQPLITCSSAPLTGFYRNGCCDTGEEDLGVHTVCVIVTQEFLEFSRAMGNNLIEPLPMYNFPGLVPGDRWCLCAARFKEALQAGVAPKVILEATHEKTLQVVTMAELLANAFKTSL